MWRYQPEERPDEYVGNFWGWRFSVIGAALVLALLALAIGVSWYRGVPLITPDPSIRPLDQIEPVAARPPAADTLRSTRD